MAPDYSLVTVVETLGENCQLGGGTHPINCANHSFQCFYYKIFLNNKIS